MTTQLKKELVVFIISNGRANNVRTYKTLIDSGYTGNIYIIIDDLDKTKNEYIKNFGEEKVIIFDKVAISKKTDQGDNFNNLRTTTHVRNACFDIAKDLGYEYFIVLDDDYLYFKYKFDENLNFISVKYIKNLDDVFSAMLKYFKSAKQISTIALGQEGELIGGPQNIWGKKVGLKRKAMNSFLCSTERRFNFIGRLNEDVNTYVNLGSRGFLFFTFFQATLTQMPTQKNSGGMTDAYLDAGTYVKSFYTVMYQPSSVKIRKNIGRLHHKIKWENTVPMILRENIKK